MEQTFKVLQGQTDNQYCFDCGAADAEATSVNNGIFICMKCHDQHKPLGDNVSKVKVPSMDSWTNTEIQFLWNGGNNKLREFLEGYYLN